MSAWIIQSSVLILVITALRFALRGRIKLRLQYALWALVLLRLLIPVSLGQSAVSLLNFIPERTAAVQAGAPASESGAAAPVQAAEPEIPAQPAPAEEPVLPASPAEGRTAQAERPAAAAAEQVEPAAARPDARQLALGIWALGGGAVLLAALISDAVFSQRLRRSRKPVELEGFPLPVYCCRWIETPCLAGLFRPAVYINPALLEDGPGLRHVLCHELTHYRHGDAVWTRLRCLCLALHWYNPLVWLAAALSRRDAELACDEAAIARLGEGERSGYGRTLIGLTCTGRAGLLSMATTMTGSRRGLRERICLIAEKPRMAAATLILVLLVAFAAAGCTFTGGKGGEEAQVIHTEEPTAEKEPIQTAAPVSYTGSFQNADGTVDFSVQLENVNYTGGSMRELRVSTHLFTPEEAERAAGLIFGEAELYRYDPAYYTQEELEALYQLCQQLLEDEAMMTEIFGSSDESVREAVSHYLTEAEYALHGGGNYGVAEQEPAVWEMQTDSGNPEKQSLLAYADMDGMRMTVSVRSALSAFHGGITNDLSTDLPLGGLDNISFRYDMSRLASTQPATEQQIQAVREQAEALIAQLSPGDWQIETCAVKRPVLPIVSPETEPEQYVVRVTALPLLEGRPLCYRARDYLTRPYWAGTMLSLDYSNDGQLITMHYTDPWDVLDSTGEEKPLLSLDEIMEKAREHLTAMEAEAFQLVYVMSKENYPVSVKVTLNDLRLGYASVPVEGSEREYRLVPAVALYGNCTYEFEDFEDVDRESVMPLLVINAVDGSLIP